MRCSLFVYAVVARAPSIMVGHQKPQLPPETSPMKDDVASRFADVGSPTHVAASMYQHAASTPVGFLRRRHTGNCRTPRKTRESALIRWPQSSRRFGVFLLPVERRLQARGCLPEMRSRIAFGSLCNGRSLWCPAGLPLRTQSRRNSIGLQLSFTPPVGRKGRFWPTAASYLIASGQFFTLCNAAREFRVARQEEAMQLCGIVATHSLLH